MNPDIRPPAKIWWVIWAAMVAGFVQIYLMIGLKATSDGRLWWMATVPLLSSMILRFGVLPRLLGKPSAYPLFIVTLALAEGCGMIGIFLGGAMKPLLAGCGFAALLVNAPVYLRQPKN